MKKIISLNCEPQSSMFSILIQLSEDTHKHQSLELQKTMTIIFNVEMIGVNNLKRIHSAFYNDFNVSQTSLIYEPGTHRLVNIFLNES
jgi:hypothetical protein